MQFYKWGSLALPHIFAGAFGKSIFFSFFGVLFYPFNTKCDTSRHSSNLFIIFTLTPFAETADWCGHCMKEKHGTCLGLINWRTFTNQKYLLENSQGSELVSET